MVGGDLVAAASRRVLGEILLGDAGPTMATSWMPLSSEDIIEASFLFRRWSLQVKTLPILGGRRRRALASCFFLKMLPLELPISVVH